MSPAKRRGLHKRIALILAGGKSRRFGSDKACASFGKKSFLQMLIDTLEAKHFQVSISVDAPKMIPYKTDRIVLDQQPGNGPLQAIYGFLQQRVCRHVLVVACDMPFLTSDVVELLWNNRKKADLTLLECHAAWFPLPGVYSSALLPQMKKLLAEKRYDLKALWESPITTHVLPFSNWRTADPKVASIININTPEEYQWYRFSGGGGSGSCRENGSV